MIRKEFLEIPLDVASMEETVEFIRHRIEHGEFTQQVSVNVAKLVHLRKEPKLADAVRRCEVVSADGMGIVYGAQLLGLDISERVAGIDLFHRLIAISEKVGWPVYLLGATEDVVRRASEKLRGQFPNLKIAGAHHGYIDVEDEEIAADINQSGARLLFVGISSPKKEAWIARWREGLDIAFVMGVGGTFDIVAGVVQRAPMWMQRWGLEWLYRVFQEPRRMWRRYLFTNSAFAWLLVREMWARRGRR